ncbi:translation elongation factor Ts [Prosthecomicrobium hirschii]|uniref:Elongation factor Ts n=1 Tax=Prosthecodimorpha hirschii TaxID=665126 RepID=A0A0P6VVE4_9HYPH|nr:translation elongation factor Ts [Prosthecomicrobium hirschii]KPL55215.1 elongation factor Ts [Prosthecomicrobium hirschii]MCW1839848.1 translation elongation factor Ts [Prosthecomicrobium hirschii]TPQ48689.1 elongation factor Ts [Prosthecomicrobium hirschii]
MTTISASQVKALRDQTGAGMMDCKTALIETAGDMEAAVDWLRKKGLSKAAKKSGRTAAEGLIGVAAAGNAAAVVEVNSETDFVARNEQFQGLVATIAALGLDAKGSVETLGGLTVPGTEKSVTERLTDAVATIGENMQLRRTAYLEVADGVVAHYIHSTVADGLGKIGVLVALESTGDKAVLAALGRQIAMHVAAHDPTPVAVVTEQVDPALVERERAIFAEQAAQSGKPAAVVEKMVEGRIRKFYEEVTLLKQHFVVNPDLTVEAAVKAAEKDAGAPVSVKGFVRFQIGEGIEKAESDFAAEVAAAAGTK